MGVHHAWGRTYKDLWQRFFTMLGKKQRYQNGFDEQGLWVEVEVEKELGLKSKKDIENLVPGDKFKSLEKFINLCQDRVKKFSAIQTEQSQRLGYFMDWDNSYHTSSEENNYTIWRYLATVHKKGWLYKGRDSVPWCPRCGTAISQHEILTEEYQELTHKTVVFKLPLKGKKNEYLLAWTTTPWTIPGNVALAVDPDRSYWKMTNNKGEKIILINPTASGNVEKEAMLVERLDLTKGWVKHQGGEIKGKDLIGLEYEAPYNHLPAVKKTLGKYQHQVVSADPKILAINPAEGTGIVHIAPGAGAEDFRLGIKEKIPSIEEIDETGIFLEGFEFLSSLDVNEASKKILEDLKNRNLAFKIADYTHRYPTCWRCKTELVWRVVDEWYIAMDHPSRKASDGKQTYRQMMMEVAKKIDWIPEWGLDRELDWLKNMHDWLISKKRYWGLALPVWECHKCGNFEVIDSRDELQKKAVAGWDQFTGHSPHRPWIDQIKIKCSKCNESILRIPDVGNPWLDAGIVPFSTMPEDWFPADFITESFPGQFKNWFYSLIAMSTVLKNTNPFQAVLGFASVRDDRGEEMHKSKGNAIEFGEAADKIGVDVMRWIYSIQNPEQNLNFGYHTADETRRRFYLILWNVYSFFVTYANLDKWTPPAKFSQHSQSANILDRWVLTKLYRLVELVTSSLASYDAMTASRAIEEFVVDDLSGWYIRRSRDRVGPTVDDSQDKDAFYQTCHEVLVKLSKTLAPFIPFIAEEIYQNLTGEESVHLSDWPKPDSKQTIGGIDLNMSDAIKLASVVHAFRKTAGVKVRIPFKKLHYSGSKIPDEILKIVEDEVNVYHLEYRGRNEDFQVDGDISVANQDLQAGQARELIRTIQEKRKEAGCALDELIEIVVPNWPASFEKDILKQTLAKSITSGPELSVVRIS